MNEAQVEVVSSLVRTYSYVAEWRHGDCIGADAQFHDILLKVLGPHVLDRIWIHPSTRVDKRAYKQSPHIFRPKDPILRNHDMVNVTQGLIATPKLAFEIVRSGTWTTIRYARKFRRPIFIVYPNGSLKIENPTEIRGIK